MEKDGKEMIVQCESDKGVSRKYQNKALALSLYLFIYFYFSLMWMVGKVSSNRMVIFLNECSALHPKYILVIKFWLLITRWIVWSTKSYRLWNREKEETAHVLNKLPYKLRA